MLNDIYPNESFRLSGIITPVMNLNGGLSVPELWGDGSSLEPATTSKLGGIIVGEDLKITPEGVLSVDKATAVEEDNTKPITAAAVYAEIGNIDAILQTI